MNKVFKENRVKLVLRANVVFKANKVFKGSPARLVLKANVVFKANKDFKAKLDQRVSEEFKG